MTFSLRKSGWLVALTLSLCQGCREDGTAPIIGPNRVRNGSFESGLDGWWEALNGKDGKVETRADAADLGAAGLVLHKSTGEWGTMVGQETEGHPAMQTFQIRARIKGAVGGEAVSLSFSGQGFEVTAEERWRTVSRLVLLPEAHDNPSAIIAVTTDEATAYVDDVSIALAQVARGDADTEEGNLLRNASFESDLGLWNFWTNSLPGGTASTSPDARYSGYAGMVLTRGAEGSLTTVKQSLPDPAMANEEYQLEARIRGANGGEAVNLCLQINHDPWDGPCIQETAGKDWRHLSKKVSITEEMHDERVGVLVSLSSEGTVMVDDVIVVRTKTVR